MSSRSCLLAARKLERATLHLATRIPVIPACPEEKEKRSTQFACPQTLQPRGTIDASSARQPTLLSLAVRDARCERQTRTCQHYAAASRNRRRLPAEGGAARDPKRTRACHTNASLQAPDRNSITGAHQVRRVELFRTIECSAVQLCNPGHRDKKKKA
ncbi:hypothetical protein NDU88_003857 [Pleurodeles waltl]|uniref:Uncharacterized protein n=1 Tax=Pleurodeles waltl TaxID=8319 RepID=A0AAV7RJR5_PLEWA|nr:hypothetical protein NDU88_003857 [Pleurodeles waltl]